MNKYLKIETNSSLDNLGTVRIAVTSFLSNIHMDELLDIKTALSEAVTNAIDHAYENDDGKVITEVNLYEDFVDILVSDFGKGIEDISLAMTPAYTTKPESEHAGMGFTIMESFMDEVIIDSSINNGTKISMKKYFKKQKSS